MRVTFDSNNTDKKVTEGVVLLASRIILAARFEDAGNLTAVKHYRCNDCRVVYASSTAFKIWTYVTKESNTFRQRFA